MNLNYRILYISLFLVLSSLPLVSARFSFDAPDSAFLGENFTVSVKFDSEDTYDVKVVVQDSEKKTASDIWDGTAWKSSFYYLSAAFPDKESFTLRVHSPVHNASLCVRLRKTGSSTYEETCKPLLIVEPSTLPLSPQTFEQPSSLNLNSPSKRITTSEYTVEKSIAWSAMILSTLTLIMLCLWWAVGLTSRKRKVIVSPL